MEPIVRFLDYANRSAISVKPKAPLLEWINALYPEMPEDGSESVIYLIKEKADGKEVNDWLKKNFKKIFENELNERHTDEKDWPQKRNYKVFQEWFETACHTLTYDVEDSFIKKY